MFDIPDADGVGNPSRCRLGVDADVIDIFSVLQSEGGFHVYRERPQFSLKFFVTVYAPKPRVDVPGSETNCLFRRRRLITVGGLFGIDVTRKIESLCSLKPELYECFHSHLAFTCGEFRSSSKLELETSLDQTFKSPCRDLMEKGEVEKSLSMPISGWGKNGWSMVHAMHHGTAWSPYDEHQD